MSQFAGADAGVLALLHRPRGDNSKRYWDQHAEE